MRQYTAAAAAAILAAAARWALDRFFGYRHPYSALYIAVLWSAWYGGLGPGLLATGLGGLAAVLLKTSAPTDVPAFGFLGGFEFYWIVCLTATILFDAQRRAERRSGVHAAIAAERWQALASEIAQRQEAEESVRRAQEQSRLAFQYAPVGICQVDLDGLITESNPKFCAVTGWNHSDLIHRPLLDVLYLGDAEGADQFLDLQRGATAFFTQEKLHRRRDGAALWIGVAVSLVRGSGDRPVCAIAVVEDISARKRSEEELVRTQKMESVALLAGGIAHEFNNLLTAILGNATLAMETLAPSGDSQPMLQAVIGAAERAARLTSELLAYAGRGAFVTANLDLSTAVSAACELVRPSIPPHIALRLELPPDLPRLRADSSRIQQLISNLVLNAVEAIGNDRSGSIHTATGRMHFEESVPAAVGRVAPGDYIFVRVQDTGSGIEASILPRIFDPFFTTRFLGRGLGLAAVAGIVRSLKGAVFVSSTTGQGSTFTVVFPTAASGPGAQ